MGVAATVLVLWLLANAAVALVWAAHRGALTRPAPARPAVSVPTPRPEAADGARQATAAG